jgi:Spy/CpxP family protein refolding chaperone
MITQTRYRLLVWLVFILFTMNIATIASLAYHTSQTRKETAARQTADQAVVKAEQGAWFFREQLNLDSAQTNRFREINREYNRVAHRISYDLEQLRLEMVEQMGKTGSDTVRLNTICREIGLNHEQLKKLTVDYYLKMKSSCNENQRAKLNTIFKEMVQKEDTVATHQGKGKGYRWRGGRK